MKAMYQNSTDRALHLGPVTIPPGEARLVDAALLPQRTSPGLGHRLPPVPDTAYPPAAQPLPLQFDCGSLLCRPVREIREALPDLSLDHLTALAAAETDAANRKGVIEAIETERLRRATAHVGQEDD